MSDEFSFAVDQQDTQQQPNRAGEPAPPADGDTDPEADNGGSSWHGKKLPRLSAGALGAAAEEYSGRTKWRAGNQHERFRGSR